MILRVFLVLTLARGNLCQEITFSSPTLISPCTSKSRGGMDNYVFNGTIGKDVASLIIQGWHNVIRILLHVHREINFINYCALVFKDGKCETQTSYGCSCVYQFKQLHFVVNYTLASFTSMGTFYATWSTIPGKIPELKVLPNRNNSLPEICDVNTAYLRLTIEGVVKSLPTATFCTFAMTLSTSNRMQLCCYEMALPCYTQISFKGTVVATNKSPCVTYSPTSDVAGVAGTMDLSYSVCTQTDYRSGRNCTIQTGVITTMVTFPTTGAGFHRVTGKRTDPSPPTKSNTIEILLWVVISIILLVIIGALVAVYIIHGRRRQTSPALEAQPEYQEVNLPIYEEDAKDEEVEDEWSESIVSGSSSFSKIESEV